MNDLSQADVWRRQLGYLPVPLFGVVKERAYVMLNGGKGNFCLDVDDGFAIAFVFSSFASRYCSGHMSASCASASL